MAEAVLALSGVTVARGRRVVLHDVTLHVTAGSVVCLLGPNGAGKSTLLGVMLGTVPLRNGTVERAPDFADRSGVGFVPQRCTLDPTLPTTVAEFVDLGLLGLGLRRAARRERTAEALAAVGLGAHAARSFWNHSEGERQRILLARALARRPRHLLLDEPTASLDPLAAHQFWKLLGTLRDAGSWTVVCATHDLDAVRSVATDVALCVPGDAGSQVVTGPAAEFATTDAFARVFGALAEERR